MDEPMNGPTLQDIKTWPATVGILPAAKALGISKSHAYELVRRDEFPVKVVLAGNRRRVVTASLVQKLEADAA